MCSSTGRVWFLTDKRIKEDYPQQEILRALKAKCCDEDLEFRYVLMDEVVLTVEQGNLGCLRQISRQAIPAMKKTTKRYSSKSKRP